MEQLFERFLEDGSMFWIVAGTVAVIAIVFGSVTSMVRSSNREKTRREIAAYIASGTMTPEQGEKLMNAGNQEDA